MNFKNINISSLIIHLFVCAAYPVLKTVSAETNKLLIFTDTLTIMSFIMIIIGIIYSFYLKGDFDVTSYIMNHSIDKKRTKPVESFLKDRKKEREESFNYPLFTGLLSLFSCILITNICF